jgi:hypothetical protein
VENERVVFKAAVGKFASGGGWVQLPSVGRAAKTTIDIGRFGDESH